MIRSIMGQLQTCEKPFPKIAHLKISKDYRPIATKSHLCRLLEKLGKSYIISATNFNSQLRSTADVLIGCLCNFIKFTDAKATHYVCGLFFHLISAFNTIDVNQLVSKLRHLDVRMVTWIRIFLTDRRQYTQTAIYNILYFTITKTGITQRNLLSPILFAICTDEIHSTTAKTTILKLADRAVIHRIIANDSDTSAQFDEVSLIADLCRDPIFNPYKAHELICYIP